MTAPSAEGISYLRARPKDGARLAALRSPFGNLRPIVLLTIRYPTLAGRGGSVSRRDHNQAAGNRTQRSGGTTYAEVPKPNASRSSGEGVWGRGASLREAASPAEALPIWYPTLAGRGGSVSRRDHNQAYRRRTQRSGGTTYAEVLKPNASRSSGEGVWGRGASLREAASPPESPPKASFREGARGRGLF